MDTDEELPRCEILQATQPYVMDEDDSTPPLEEETKEEGDVQYNQIYLHRMSSNSRKIW
jgi:hypothetical protein